MKTKNKTPEKEFHSVEFMRQVRSELAQQYLQDKQKYLAYLKKQWKTLDSGRRRPTALDF